MGFKQGVENVKSDMENYVEARFQEIELSSVEKSVHVASKTLGWLVVGLLASFCFIMLAMVLIILLQQVTGSYLYSTLILGGSFAVMLILVSIFFQKLLYKPIKNLLYGVYFETKEDLK